MEKQLLRDSVCAIYGIVDFYLNKHDIGQIDLPDDILKAFLAIRQETIKVGSCVGMNIQIDAYKQLFQDYINGRV